MLLNGAVCRHDLGVCMLLGPSGASFITWSYWVSWHTSPEVGSQGNTFWFISLSLSLSGVLHLTEWKQMGFCLDVRHKQWCAYVWSLFSPKIMSGKETNTLGFKKEISVSKYFSSLKTQNKLLLINLSSLLYMWVTFLYLGFLSIY